MRVKYLGGYVEAGDDLIKGNVYELIEYKKLKNGMVYIVIVDEAKDNLVICDMQIENFEVIA